MMIYIFYATFTLGFKFHIFHRGYAGLPSPLSLKRKEDEEMPKHIRGRNEDSISERPSGHWRIRTTLSCDHRFSRTFVMKHKTLAWLRQIQVNWSKVLI
jgi:hypothetical protein